jgi:catechol 2,3-dioxygenase-like lactoylglutathione lyase family enzyme
MSQIRIARPTGDLAAASAFYGDVLGFAVLASFEEHDGYSGVIFGLPDASRQLELVSHEGTLPSPTSEDQLENDAARLRAAGFEPRPSANPYWARTGAVCFVDPDGYWLVLSPEAW